MCKRNYCSTFISPDNVKLLIAALGVFLSFFAFGVLHERITRVTYGEGENKEKFEYFTALVGFLCLFYYIVAQGIDVIFLL